MDKSKSLVPRKLVELDRALLHLGRKWRIEGFPIPLALRFKFKFGFISFDFTILAGYNPQSDTGEVIDVPTWVFDTAEALQTAKGPSKGYQEREGIRDALSNLPAGQIIRMTPDDGETMRKLKRMVTEAGKDIAKEVKHLQDGNDLLIFFAEPKPEGTPARGRPRKAKTEENGEG